MVMLKNKKYDIVFNIPPKHQHEKKKGFLTRRACLDFSVPLLTNVKCCKLFLNAIQFHQNEALIVSPIDIL